MNRRMILTGAGLATLGAGIVVPQQAVARAPLALPDAMGPLPPSWHRAEVLNLWQGAPPEGGFTAQPVPPDSPPGFIRNVAVPTLRVFRPSAPNGRAVLLIPGGAYTFIVGTHEGASTAEALTALGYTVFLLIYRLPGEGWSRRSDVPLQDAQRAMRLIRGHATRYAIDAAKVAVLGYSAGGHLAASLATAFDAPVYTPRDAIDAIDARPSAAALIYPVITLDPRHTNAQSAEMLLGPKPSDTLVALRSPERHVTAACPPGFLVHALDDRAVPCDNSIMMLAALRAAGVPAEAHFFEQGGHGFGLGAPDAPNGAWLTLLDRWLGRHFSA